MNTIGRIKFDFTMHNELFAQSLYAGWDHFFASSVEKVADDLLKRYDVETETIEIDSLCLDLGRMTETEFYEMFPIRLKEALEESLQTSLYLSESETTESVRRHSVQRNAFDILCYFLLHGTLPWYALTRQEQISDLFLQVIKDYPAELKKFLQLYGHYTTLQQRLVYQLNNPALEEGVRLMRSAESTFICSYIYSLQEKYTRLQQLQITETNYRYAIWQVVYAWILTDRSSSFDKKSFLQTTLAGLASHLNITYITLLTVLTDDIAGIIHKQHRLPELIRLLADLKEEATLKLRKEKLADLSGLVDVLGNTLRQEIDRQLSDSSFTPAFLAEWLIPSLANADSCRLLLSRMKEEEIIRLVPLVAPNESGFIIGYARSLDRQKERGALQGKAGSEFARLKWMVIFPVLLENRSAGFNRKYFVRRVLLAVAARYNLTVWDLLSYFTQQQVMEKLDPALRDILESYRSEIKETYTPQSVQQVETGIPGLISKLSGNSLLTQTEKESLSGLWSHPRDAIAFVRDLSPKGYTALVVAMANGDEQFILQYAKALDHYRQQGLLEGKASGDFRHIKWYFIFRVLIHQQGTTSNRHHLTASVLRDLAAHYNLAYFDLLQYFYANDRFDHLPPVLSVILQELYWKERQQQVGSLLSLTGENERQKLLEKLYPAETPFIRSVLKLISDPSFIRKIGGDSSYSRLIWEKIFHALAEYTGRPFVKQAWLMRLMQLLATHYKYKTETIYTYLSNSIRQGTISTTPDLKQIIMDQSNHWNDLDFIQPNNDANQQGAPDVYYVHNAGVVLIFPFFTRLFSLLGLVENGKFISEEAKVRAIFILQYVVYGEEFAKKEFPEYELTLNKLLVGYNSGKPLPKTLELTADEKKITEDMLSGVLNHWEKLRRTSTGALRQAFLERSGALKVEDDRYLLTVEEKAYDMLIDSMPWSYNMIKYPWMEKRMEVKWR